MGGVSSGEGERQNGEIGGRRVCDLGRLLDAFTNTSDTHTWSTAGLQGFRASFRKSGRKMLFLLHCSTGGKSHHRLLLERVCVYMYLYVRRM